MQYVYYIAITYRSINFLRIFNGSCKMDPRIKKKPLIVLKQKTTREVQDDAMCFATSHEKNFCEERLGRWVLNRNFWRKCSRDIETDRKQWYISKRNAGFSSTILRGPYHSLSRAIERNDFRVADFVQNFKRGSVKFSNERVVETGRILHQKTSRLKKQNASETIFRQK